MLNSSRVHVVGVGLNATDTVISLPHYPAVGSKVEIRSAQILPGGQVASAMIACQRWGLRTRYVGKLGEDTAAEIHRAEFAKAGVETHLAIAPGCASQQSFILVDEAGERTVLWKRDPALTLRPNELNREWIVAPVRYMWMVTMWMLRFRQQHGRGRQGYQLSPTWTRFIPVCQRYWERSIT